MTNVNLSNMLPLSQPVQPKGKGAAKDFEALLVAQMLHSVRGEGGWLGGGDDQSSDAAIGFGEEQLSQAISASGGLGLSKLINFGLKQAADKQQPAA